MDADLSQWFDRQLRSTLDGFIWAVHQLPKDRLHTLPPSALGEWSAAQHVFHMFDYEKRLALPTMFQWLGESPAILKKPEYGMENNPIPIEEMLSQFKQIRGEEIGLLPKFDSTAWDTMQKTTVWGEVSLYWLVCKTYQHTNEHTHNILRLTLFWDRILARMVRE